MAKKINCRRARIRPANHGRKPCIGRRPRKVRGTGRK